MRESVIGATRERAGPRFFQIGHRRDHSITGAAPLDTRFSLRGVTKTVRVVVQIASSPGKSEQKNAKLYR
jgi:hypothetical protein